ncbi:MAG TPA: hypothetical protein ENI57_08830 [Ignavibacteria bacterium]|nr:hypothetical protein [Ignavibacteria bacterium]
MKKLLIVYFLLLFGSTSFSQYSIRTGLGIELKNTSSFYDYINQNFAPANGQLKNFNTTVNFSAEIDRTINDNFDVGVEMAYGLYSFNYQYNLGLYKISTNNFMPSLLAYYVLSGKGYNFKFGGGAGLRFINVDELLPGTPTATTYSSTGVGFIIRGMGNTQVGKNLYANITADLRFDLNNDVSNGGKKLFNPALNKNVKFNSFSAGLTLGITYLF